MATRDEARVPQEICDHIIDSTEIIGPPHIRRKTLLACSLTCRAWVRRSRMHLVKSVTLVNRAQVAQVARFIAAAPHLAALVDEVLIDNPWDKRHTAPAHLPVFAAMFARKLPRLRALEIRNGSWQRTATDMSLYRALEEFTSITTLTLTTVEFSSVYGFTRLVRAIPNLKRLKCFALDWRRTGLALVGIESHAPSLRLETLRIMSNGVSMEDEAARAQPRNVAVTADILNLVTLSKAGERLQELHLGFLEGKNWAIASKVDAMGTSRLLHLCGPSLHTLKLTCTARNSQATEAEEMINLHLGLGHAVMLKSLHVFVPHVDRENSCGWIGALLLQVSSRHLQECTIVMDSYSGKIDVGEILLTTFTPDLCSRIDAFFTQPQFKELRSFVIEVSGYSKTMADGLSVLQWQGSVAALFPKLRDAGILLTRPRFQVLRYGQSREVVVTAADQRAFERKAAAEENQQNTSPNPHI